MTTAFVHVCVGFLVALALRLDWPFVPYAAVLAELPDLDHLWGNGLRSGLHTWWFLVLLPSAVAGLVISWPGITLRWRRLAAAAPVLLLSHLLLDLFPQASEVSSRYVPLLLPFDQRLYMVAPFLGHASSPPSLSTLGIVMAILALGAALGCLAPWAADWLERTRRRSWWAGLAYGAWGPLWLGVLLLTRVVRPA